MSDELADLLRHRALELARLPEQREQERDRMELLRLRVGTQRYALRSAYVDEVLPWVGGRRVPGAAPWIVGIFARRGQLVTVVDLARRLGCEGPCQQVVVLGAGERRLGLAVTRVDELTDRPQRLDRAPENTAPEVLALLEGVLDDGGVLLNAAFLLNPEAFRAV